jgi:DMSO/TMAO reductase YedYZ molybdopterin-dependent catalytic subunit
MTYVILLGMFVYRKRALIPGLLLVGLAFSFGLTNPTLGVLAEAADETETLESVEIREYEGIDLSSIDAFRENSIKGPQYIDAESYTLTVSGLVENELQLTYDEVVNGYRRFEKVVTLNCVEGWSVTILWEGILVKDLIEAAGVEPNANTVIFYAYDNYSTSVPLQYLIDNDIIMAYKMNNVTLPPERGYPFQLVAESKWGYKWIKWITKIELSDNAGYQGYWESRGYPNYAGLEEPFFVSGPYYGILAMQNAHAETIPEFPSLMILSLLIAIVILAVIIYRKKLAKNALDLRKD